MLITLHGIEVKSAALYSSLRLLSSPGGNRERILLPLVPSHPLPAQLSVLSHYLQSPDRFPKTSLPSLPPFPSATCLWIFQDLEQRPEGKDSGV